MLQHISSSHAKERSKRRRSKRRSSSLKGGVRSLGAYRKFDWRDQWVMAESLKFARDALEQAKIIKAVVKSFHSDDADRFVNIFEELYANTCYLTPTEIFVRALFEFTKPITAPVVTPITGGLFGFGARKREPHDKPHCKIMRPLSEEIVIDKWNSGQVEAVVKLKPSGEKLYIPKALGKIGGVSRRGKPHHLIDTLKKIKTDAQLFSVIESLRLQHKNRESDRVARAEIPTVPAPSERCDAKIIELEKRLKKLKNECGKTE